MSDSSLVYRGEDEKETNPEEINKEDYKKKRAEERKHAYFYEKTTPLSRLIKIAQHQTKHP